jgi:hypothetical protein
MQRGSESPQGRPSTSADDTGIEVNTSFFPLAWILLFCTPRIAIDGREERRPWGTHFFAMRPGRHEVAVWFPYLLMSRCGYNSRTVEIRPGETTRVTFYMWPLVFLSGSMTVAQGERSESTRNASGSAPMSKTGVWAGLAAFALLIVAPTMCCCGVGIYFSVTSTPEAKQRAREQACRKEERRLWAALNKGEWKEVYERSAPSYRANNSLEQFKSMAADFQGVSMAEANQVFSDKSANDWIYRFEYKDRNVASGPVSVWLKMRQIGETWMLDDFSVNK